MTVRRRISEASAPAALSRFLRQAAKEVAQFVGHADAGELALVEECGVVGFVEAVKDDLLGVDHGHEAETGVERAVAGDFLRVGVLGPSGACGGGAGIEHFEGERALEARGVLGRKHPVGVEVTNLAQAGDNGALGAGGRQHQEVVGEGWVARVLLGEVEVEVNHRRHEIGLARAHGEGEEVIRVGDAVEKGLEVCLAGLLFGQPRGIK